MKEPASDDAAAALFAALTLQEFNASLSLGASSPNTVETMGDALVHIEVEQYSSGSGGGSSSRGSSPKESLDEPSLAAALADGQIPGHLLGKPQICFDFTKGMCSRGDKCKYSHDLATIVTFNSKEKGICFDYLRNQCHRGLLCRFSHDLSNIAQQCQVYTGGAATRGKTSAICYDFVKGFCQRGSECRYSHDLGLIARTARGGGIGTKAGEVCYDYLRGRCTRGPSCKYSHNCEFLSASGNFPPVLGPDGEEIYTSEQQQQAAAVEALEAAAARIPGMQQQHSSGGGAPPGSSGGGSAMSGSEPSGASAFAQHSQAPMMSAFGPYGNMSPFEVQQQHGNGGGANNGGGNNSNGGNNNGNGGNNNGSGGGNNNYGSGPMPMAHAGRNYSYPTPLPQFSPSLGPQLSSSASSDFHLKHHDHLASSWDPNSSRHLDDGAYQQHHQQQQRAPPSGGHSYSSQHFQQAMGSNGGGPMGAGAQQGFSRPQQNSLPPRPPMTGGLRTQLSLAPPPNLTRHSAFASGSHGGGLGLSQGQQAELYAAANAAQQQQPGGGGSSSLSHAHSAPSAIDVASTSESIQALLAGLRQDNPELLARTLTGLAAAAQAHAAQTRAQAQAQQHVQQTVQQQFAQQQQQQFVQQQQQGGLLQGGGSSGGGGMPSRGSGAAPPSPQQQFAARPIVSAPQAIPSYHRHSGLMSGEAMSYTEGYQQHTSGGGAAAAAAPRHSFDAVHLATMSPELLPALQQIWSK